MEQFLVFEKRIGYDVVDVTRLLTAGCNAIGVSFGTGWYNQSTIKSGPKSLWTMLPVTYASGTTATFGSSQSGFTSASGPVVMDEIYLGENYDARLKQKGASSETQQCGSPRWRPATRRRRRC